MTKSRCRSRRIRPRKRCGRRKMRKTRFRGGKQLRRISGRPRHAIYRRRTRKIIMHPKRCARPREDVDTNLKAKRNRRLNESFKQHQMPSRLVL
uniref:Uncharacterized protein n=1 Tax=Callorhinchus milii TaxID=7868 RepID=A0A4W3HC88_CALMI